MLSSTLSTEAEAYLGKFPFFREPTEYGHFSHDQSRNVSFDRTSLKTLKVHSNSESVDFDLREGFNTFIQKEETKSIDDLLKWLLHNKQKFYVEHQDAALNTR